jgi:DNA-binding NtrC family response regulator
VSEHILVVDDEPSMRIGLKEVLKRAGYDVETANNGEEAIKRLDEGGLDVVITDLRMPGKDGMDVLRHAQSKHPDVLVYMITAHGDVPTAVEAMKLGAGDFIQKPFKIDEVRARVRAGLDKRELKTAYPKGDVAEGEVDDALWDSFPEITGRSSALGRVLITIRKVAPSPLPILVLGETGTGKELVARAIHRLSGRDEEPFVATTGHLPEALIESELFGHMQGSFTGAIGDKAGYFEAAGKGTFFLDEVGDLPLGVQVKLLRVIQEREVVRVGEATPRKVNARLVAATNRNLEQAVESKAFREDLLYRLNVITVVLPPLRERGDDVMLLAKLFLGKAAAQAGRDMSILPEGEAVLRAHSWPGNVRELQHACESLAYLAEADQVTAADVQATLQ